MLPGVLPPLNFNVAQDAISKLYAGPVATTATGHIINPPSKVIGGNNLVPIGIGAVAAFIIIKAFF